MLLLVVWFEVGVNERRYERDDSQRSRLVVRREDTSSADLRQQSSVSNAGHSTSHRRNTRQVSQHITRLLFHLSSQLVTDPTG